MNKLQQNMYKLQFNVDIIMSTLCKIFLYNCIKMAEQTGHIQRVGKLDDSTIVSTTWILNRNIGDTEAYNFFETIRNKCQQHDMATTYEIPYHVSVTGTAGNYADTFDIHLEMCCDTEKDYTFFTPSSNVPIPPELKDVLITVLGLDSRRIAHPYFCRQNNGNFNANNELESNYLTRITPVQFASLYNFPQNLNGSGQKIGIIELGGGYKLSDIQQYFNNLNINDAPNITDISINGATNNPADTSGANIEVIMDIEIIAAIVPKANIRVYFAPNSYSGFYNAINQAIIDDCDIISISWGSPESNWTLTSLSTFNSLFQIGAGKGISIYAAAGDNGSSDGTQSTTTDFPSSSPYVIGCGGTTLRTNDGINIVNEIVWNTKSTQSATGGGVSNVFSMPSYQSTVTFNLQGKRGVPDICGNADPQTGYAIYSAGEGGNIIVGGTSAVAPLWSALTARINQSTGTQMGLIQQRVYPNVSVCRDVVSGNNGAYNASTGWDPCTGCGSPIGTSLLNLFSSNLDANFTGNPLSGTAPLVVNFTDTSTGSPTSWSWDFGDGTTSNTQNPTHTYNTAGLFNVSLTVNKTGSSPDTMTKANFVSVAPPIVLVASFTGTPLSGTVPLVVNFTDTSTGSPTSWNWDFGDGTTSNLQNPTHTYSTAGLFNVSLTINKSGVLPASLAKSNYVNVYAVQTFTALFTGTPLSGTAPLVVNFTDTSTGSPTSWSWNFGDSTTSNLQNPTHTYSTAGLFDVSLTINKSGTPPATMTKADFVSVTTPIVLVASFAGTPSSGTAPLVVNFTDTSTGSPTSWSWNFGDGTTSNLQNPTHTYSTAGSFDVSLTINKSGASPATITKTDYIIVSSPNNTLGASFVGSPLSGTAPVIVNFVDTSTGSPTSWNWNFGDGTTSNVQNPIHTYNSVGIYTVSLTIDNDIAAPNTITKQNYVSVTSPSSTLAVSFVGTPLSGTIPLTVSFVDTSTGNPTAWYWNFGDGTTSRMKNPKHTYTKSGNFSVKLTITKFVITKSVTKPNYITVERQPLAAGFATSILSTRTRTLQFIDKSTGTPTKWMWDFGDGTKSIFKNPIHSYGKGNTYTVKLTVSNDRETKSITQNTFVPNEQAVPNLAENACSMFKTLFEIARQLSKIYTMK